MITYFIESYMPHVASMCWLSASNIGFQTSLFNYQHATDFISFEGVKWHTLVMIRYVSHYIIHNMIRSTIHLLFLAGKQRPTILACDQEHCTPPATAACALCAMGTKMAASLEFPGTVFLCRISFYCNILVVICQHLLFICNCSKR